MFYLVFDKLILREVSRHANTKYELEPKRKKHQFQQNKNPKQETKQ